MPGLMLCTDSKEVGLPLEVSEAARAGMWASGNLFGAQEDRVTEGNEDGHALSGFLVSWLLPHCHPVRTGDRVGTP